MLAALALAVASFVFTTASAQTAADIRGVVADSSDGGPVAGAVVKLTDAEGRILRYSVTDRAGAFVLRQAAPPAGSRLQVSMLGYASREIAPAKDGGPMRIALDPAATPIREVVVKAPRVSMQGDTITYNARSFTDVKDKSLADILKKMPGIEVSKSGQVKYQGEAINKLYIDGVDMLGDRYGLATSNISPRDVKSVDVMENHQPKKVLRDVEFSDKAALNIRMDARVQNRWTGSAEAGAGFSPLLWNGALFTMCMAKGWSVIQTVKSNNTGAYFGTETAVLGLAGGSAYSLPQYVGVGTSAAPIDRGRTRFNTSHLYNGAGTVRLSEDYNLHVRASYLYDRLTSRDASRTTWYVGGEEFSAGSVSEAADGSHTLAVEARLTANTDKFFLNNVLSADVVRRDVWRTTEGTYPNSERAAAPSRQVKNALEFIRRLGRRTLTVRSDNIFLCSPQTLAVERDGGESYQRVDSRAFRSNTSASFGWRLGRFNLSLSGGFSQLVRRLDSSLEGVGEPIGQLCNDMRVSVSKIELAPSLNYNRGRLNASLRMPLAYGIYSVRDRIDVAASRHVGDAVVSPSLSLRYALSPMLSLSGSASYTVAPVDEAAIHSGVVMKNYRYVSRGFFIADNNRSASLGVRAEYKNPLSSLFVNLNAGYASSRLHAAPSQDFVGDYIVTSAVRADLRTSTRYLRGGVSKGIDALRGKVGIDFEWQFTASGTVQDGVYDSYDSQRVAAGPMFDLRIVKWWSAEYRLSYGVSKLKVGATGAKNSVDNMTQSLTTVLQPVKGLRFELSAEHYRNLVAADSRKNMALLDAKAAYSFSNGWELSVSARNLLDVREYSYSLFDGLSASQASWRIRPRNVLLGLYVKF